MVVVPPPLAEPLGGKNPFSDPSNTGSNPFMSADPTKIANTGPKTNPFYSHPPASDTSAALPQPAPPYSQYTGVPPFSAPASSGNPIQSQFTPNVPAYPPYNSVSPFSVGSAPGPTYPHSSAVAYDSKPPGFLPYQPETAFPSHNTPYAPPSDIPQTTGGYVQYPPNTFGHPPAQYYGMPPDPKVPGGYQAQYQPPGPTANPYGIPDPRAGTNVPSVEAKSVGYPLGNPALLPNSMPYQANPYTQPNGYPTSDPNRVANNTTNTNPIVYPDTKNGYPYSPFSPAPAANPAHTTTPTAVAAPTTASSGQPLPSAATPVSSSQNPSDYQFFWLAILLLVSPVGTTTLEVGWHTLLMPIFNWQQVSSLPS